MGPADMRAYLGGIGLGAKILFDEVPPDVTWDHPDNRLVLATVRATPRTLNGSSR